MNGYAFVMKTPLRYRSCCASRPMILERLVPDVFQWLCYKKIQLPGRELRSSVDAGAWGMAGQLAARHAMVGGHHTATRERQGSSLSDAGYRGHLPADS